MRVLHTLRTSKPIRLMEKVKEGRRKFLNPISVAYEIPAHILVQYENGMNIPAPLCMPFKDMLKHSTKMDVATISSWLMIKLADKNRSRALVMDYVHEHNAWRERNGQE